ncbi:MAG: hypothetical protein ACYCYK_01625 [Candidatus Dormibacteria bacterium]
MELSPLVVDTEGPVPIALGSHSGRIRVESRGAHWVIEVGWWRTPPARWERRDYWRLLLEDGRCLDLYWNGAERGWRLGRAWG